MPHPTSTICDSVQSSVAYVEYESDEDYDGPIGISSTITYPVEVIGHREDPWMGRVALIRMTGRVPSGAARVHEVHADDAYVTAVSAS